MSMLLPAAILSAQETGPTIDTKQTGTTPRKWTLDDCIRHAMENSITLKKNQVTILSSKEDVEQAKAALLPSLSASTNQSFGWRPWNEAGVSTVANGTVVN